MALGELVLGTVSAAARGARALGHGSSVVSDVDGALTLPRLQARQEHAQEMGTQAGSASVTEGGDPSMTDGGTLAAAGGDGGGPLEVLGSVFEWLWSLL